MNKDKFYKQLEQPQLLSRDDIDSLQELVEQYPYFASARVLLAKALHSANDHRFDEALQLAAVFAGDRKVLYDLVMKENLKQRIRDLDEAVSKDTDEVEEQEELTEMNVEETDVIEKEAEQSPAIEPVKSEDADHREEETESETATDPVEEEIEQQEEPESEAEVEDEQKQTYDEYEQEILYEAINSTISREVSEEDEDKRIARSENQQEAQESSEEESEGKETVESASPTSYSEWLRKRASEIHYHEKSGDEEASQSTSSREGEKVTESSTQKEEDSPSQDELIERFIEKEPKITPRKADMFSSENLAKMSVVEDASFVTETMAKIFAKQGNLRKAKRAYKLLSLKYPEKSIYFANQIKKLQGKK